MNTSDTHARIAAAIDWQPTCLPGDEQRTIVRQVLDAASVLAETSDPAAANLLELAEKWGAESLRRRAAAEFEAQHDQQEMVGESHALGDCAQELRAALAAAATPAPPVDVAARLLAMADIAGQLGHLSFACDLRDLVERFDALSGTGEPHVQEAIARALTATPTEKGRTNG